MRDRPSDRALVGRLAHGAAAIALTLAVSACGREVAQPAEVGFNNNAVTEGTATPDGAAKLLADVGADVDRVQINWAALEPEPGEYDFTVYDQIYRADLAAGIEPLFIFAFAPPWAAAPGVCDAALPGCHVPPAREHYADAARTAAALAERYPKAAGIEIWNEPNADYFWAPAPDPVAYADLLKACYRAIKRVAPDMPVAGGSTASGAARPGKIADVDFVEAMFAEGADRSLDALSVHAYPAPGDAEGWTAADSVEAIRGVQEEAGSEAPLWVTETGVSVTGPDAVSEADQAATLEGLAGVLGGVDGVEMVLVHTLVRSVRPPEDPEGGFGVIDSELRPLPGYCALSEDWGGAAPC